MYIGNRTKRNIHLTLLIMGCAIIAIRIIDPIMSGGFHKMDWINLFSAIVITLLCFFSYQDYCKKIKEGQK